MFSNAQAIRQATGESQPRTEPVTLNIPLTEILACVENVKVSREWNPDLMRYDYEVSYELLNVGGWDVDDYGDGLDEIISQALIEDYES